MGKNNDLKNISRRPKEYMLKLGESIVNESKAGEILITRVAGGWIYTIMIHSIGGGFLSASSVFVPFNSEFKNTRKK